MRHEAQDDVVEFDGLVKLRLLHAKHGSILLPDMIMIRAAGSRWFQPRWVYAPLLDLTPPGTSTLHVGLATKHGGDLLVEVIFDGEGFQRFFCDRSQLYACRVRGPAYLVGVKSGQWRLRADGGVDLRLFHHTTDANKRQILKSTEVWGSAWNFQGNKRLINCSYAYFTNLQRINDRSDLQRIAMAHDGRLRLRLDNSPAAAPPDLVIDVYREATENRRSTITLWVPAEHLAPSHIWQHTTSLVEYEVTHPWIFRVCMVPSGRYQFERDAALFDQTDLKGFDSIVLGDCTTVDGLRAPYDEEDTSQTFLIQDLGDQTVFEFWLANGNQAIWAQDGESQVFAESD